MVFKRRSSVHRVHKIIEVLLQKLRSQRSATASECERVIWESHLKDDRLTICLVPAFKLVYLLCDREERLRGGHFLCIHERRLNCLAFVILFAKQRLHQISFVVNDSGKQWIVPKIRERLNGDVVTERSIRMPKSRIVSPIV